MASNLSSIGFVFENAEDFQARVIALAAQTRERFSCEACEYAIWRSRTGAELWFHLAGAEGEVGASDIIGLTPFFEGESRVAMHITAAIERPEDNAHEGLLYGWVLSDGKIGSDAFPLVFDAIDFAAHSGRPLPAVWTCRICGFCRDLKLHASAESLPELGEGQRIAPQAFIPIGLFGDGEAETVNTASPGGDNDNETPPEPIALLTGIVRAHKMLTNEASGRTFHWMRVESLIATFDLVADPEIVEGAIVEGAIVETIAWLFGRVLD